MVSSRNMARGSCPYAGSPLLDGVVPTTDKLHASYICFENQWTNKEPQVSVNDFTELKENIMYTCMVGALLILSCIYTMRVGLHKSSWLTPVKCWGCACRCFASYEKFDRLNSEAICKFHYLLA
jgi:hypothetical protein